MTNDHFKALFKEVFKPLIQEVIKEEMTAPAPTIKNPEQMLSVKAAMQEFGFPNETMLRRAMNAGELPYYTPNNRLYLKRSEVAKYKDSIRVKTNDEVQDYSFLKKR